MAVWPIDGNKLIEWFRPYLHTGEAIPADVVIEDIRSMPTLTPSNEALTPCDVCKFSPPSSSDGKPCCMCPAERRSPEGELNG